MKQTRKKLEEENKELYRILWAYVFIIVVLGFLYIIYESKYSNIKQDLALCQDRFKEPIYENRFIANISCQYIFGKDYEKQHSYEECALWAKVCIENCEVLE